MADKKDTGTRTRLFVSTIIIAGRATLARPLYELYGNPTSNEWMLLAKRTLLNFSFTVKVPGIAVNILVSETFVFTTVLLFGTAGAIVTVALDALIMSGRRDCREPFQVLFNATEPDLSILVASHLFFLIVKEPLRNSPRNGGFLLFPVLVLSLSHFLLNSILMAAAIGLQSGARIASVLQGHFLWLALNYLGGAYVALSIVHSLATITAKTKSTISPLLVITNLTFRRVEQLNQMYISAIET
jgi:hypothetical protein